jgi:hypothetical protein
MRRKRPTLKDRRRDDRNGTHLYDIIVQGLHTAGQPVRETLVEQGHYRCPCCRRADAAESSAASARPAGNRNAMLATK